MASLRRCRGALFPWLRIRTATTGISDSGDGEPQDLIERLRVCVPWLLRECRFIERGHLPVRPSGRLLLERSRLAESVFWSAQYKGTGDWRQPNQHDCLGTAGFELRTLAWCLRGNGFALDRAEPGTVSPNGLMHPHLTRLKRVGPEANRVATDSLRRHRMALGICGLDWPFGAEAGLIRNRCSD